MNPTNIASLKKNHVNRRDFVKTAAIAGAGLAFVPALARASGQTKATATATATDTPPSGIPQSVCQTTRGLADRTSRSPNILMIVADDLRAWLHCLGCEQVRTPNLDRLAAMGMVFTRSYCPAPLCNPSRTALFTGKRPGTTGIYNNTGDWRTNEVTRDLPSLIETLRAHGYLTFGAGKIYHEIFTKLSEWDDYGGTGLNGQKPLPSPAPDGDGVSDILFRPLIGEDNDMVDSNAVDYCIAKLRTMPAALEKPFLLGCGFHKPHLPMEVPQKYFDMYPLNQIELPKVQPSLDGIPPLGVRTALTGGEHEAILKSGRWKEAVRAYLACVTFVDAQIGRLLDALEKSACKDNTIILFWTDHGWHHGEKQHWKKSTLWEEAARTPLIWVVPGVTAPGSTCARTVDHMGIYPTLCELAGIPAPPHVEGASYASLLKNPQAAWSRPAVTTNKQNNHAVRSEKWCYIRYSDGTEELYDHDADPLEWKNLAGDPRHAPVKEDLKQWLPKINRPISVTSARSKPDKGKHAGDDE